jgi:hypothetical protein
VLICRNRNFMKLEDEIDALFRLPLAEFTGARNALAARLKKDGSPNEAERVKLLAKPSVSAWAVNQLYWTHREEFEQLIAAGKRFRPAQKAADRRDSLDARREVLAELSELATALLSDAGHSPTLDTLRRVTTTLEAMSAYALLPDGPTPGRLSSDLDPPSFESLASLVSGGAMPRSKDAAPVKAGAKQKPAPTIDARRIRQAKIAAAKVSLQDAKRLLNDARARAQSFEAAQKNAEKHKREAEERLAKATAASEAAARRAQTVAAEAREATNALEDAKRTVANATKVLESLLREPAI